MRFLRNIIARKVRRPDDEFYTSIELADVNYSGDLVGSTIADMSDDLSDRKKELASFDTTGTLTLEERIANEVDGATPDSLGETDGLAQEPRETAESDHDEEFVDILKMLGNDAANVTPPRAEAAEVEVEVSSGSGTYTAPHVDRDQTRILGLNGTEPKLANEYNCAAPGLEGSPGHFPVGWLVLIDGPGCGASFTLQNGVSNIGRGHGQTIKLDFGDCSISRESHSSIVYDDDVNEFFIGHSGKTNPVRRNGRPVISTEELSNGDLIRIGETTLRFVKFCNTEFAWDLTGEEEIVHARVG